MRVPPSDAIREVFTDEVRARLYARPDKSERLEERLAILAARGPVVDPARALVSAHPPCRRAQKAAWETYLSAAHALGLFEEPHAADLRARLTGADDDAFRAAMAECMVGWVLAGKLRLRVSARPEGRRGRPLEYLIHQESGDIRVEVKSPYRALPEGGVWSGDDSDLLASALKEANEQFAPGVRNLLVLAPSTRIPVYRDRGQLARAFYGQPVFTMPIDVSKGHAVGPVAMEFSPDGRFLACRTPKGGLLKPDGSPAYTRVGAVLCVEEELQGGNSPRVEHQLLVAHNPHAPNTIPPEMWGKIPQLLLVAGEMAWNDGGRAF